MQHFCYRAFPLRSFSATGHFHYVAFPLRGNSITWFFRYMTFLLCGVYATWHFPCTVYPWYFCVFRPFTFESDFSIFSIHCVGVTCMFYCTPFSGCFRGGHACFSFSHFLRFSHIISSSSLFSQSEATQPTHGRKVTTADERYQRPEDMKRKRSLLFQESKAT